MSIEIQKQINVINAKLSNLLRQEMPLRFDGIGNVSIPILTSGSVIFAAASGVLSQDNANFFWDDSNNRLGIGTTGPAYKLDVNGSIRAVGDIYLTKGSSPFVGATDNYDLRLGVNTTEYMRITTGGLVGVGVTPTALLDVKDGTIRARDGSNVSPTSGKGLELLGTGGSGYVQSYDRDSSAWQVLNLRGSQINLDINGSNSFYITNGGFLRAGGDYHISGTGSGTTSQVDLGDQATGNRYCLIDLHGDDTYTDYGLRIIRNNGGANTSSQIQSRGTGSLDLMTIDAGYIQFYTSNALRWVINPSGDMYPNGGGSLNLGNAVAYMNDVSYKTLTDRGCLAFIDEWETIDGKKVSNLDAIRNMKPHATEKTVYGEVKLDYASVPKHSYKPAKIADEDVELDIYDSNGKKLKFKKGEQIGDNGVEMTSVFSMMLGAIRELSEEIDKLKSKK